VGSEAGRFRTLEFGGAAKRPALSEARAASELQGSEAGFRRRREGDRWKVGPLLIRKRPELGGLGRFSGHVCFTSKLQIAIYRKKKLQIEDAIKPK